MKSLARNIAALLGAASLIGSAGALADDNRYIVQFTPGQAGQGAAAVQTAGGRIEVDLTGRSINAMAITIPEAALNGLRNNPNIVNIEADGRIYPMADSVPYGIDMVQAPLAAFTGPANRTVCIIDSGYHIGHSDLPVAGVTASNLPGSGDPFIDSCGHGTHVAGTIAALANGDGVVGVMPGGNLDLHITKVFGDDNWTSGACAWSYTSDLISAAYDCADAGANVINMSLGGGAASTAAEQAFNDLFNANILAIAAAGNDGNTTLSYPASYPAVISVAAIDANKVVADFSQKNAAVELAAPGVSVTSTVPSIDAVVTVDRDYVVSSIDRAARTTASGALVNGGLCNGTGNWSGQVVLCERGLVSFADKIANVEASGGSAAIIYNNEPGGFGGLISCNGPSWRACSAIPAVSMSQQDGQSLVGGQLGSGAVVSTIATAPANGYAPFDGTSMATPHVAGVAALVWSHNPSWTAAQIREALTATAQDLGTPGRDNSYGYGLVQAAAALDFLGGGGGGTNVAPSAAFSYSCTELSCSFDGSASSDSDGTITAYSWTFGDGNGASGASASHSYAGEGSYTVTLTVTDNDGATASTSQQLTVQAPTGGGVTLNGSGYKVKGAWTTDLSWSGATSNSVDVYRNGSLLTTTANDGAYTDATSFKGSGSLNYQVCEAGSNVCSDSITVAF